MRVLPIVIAVLMSAPVAAASKPAPQIMTLKGHCDRLEIPKMVLTDACNGALVNASFSGGRAEFNFATARDVIITFTGLGTAQIKPDPDSAVQPVDAVIMAIRGKSNASTKAVGFCRFANPYKGPVKISCFAETAEGTFTGDFTTDGSPPNLMK
jgi:hypothetical protein